MKIYESNLIVVIRLFLFVIFISNSVACVSTGDLS